MRRLAHIIVLAAFVFSCGGQWYAFQCVAWIKMIHDYSQMVPFTEAVSMTFSGQYPCAICKAISEKQQQENDKICSFEKFEKKLVSSISRTVPPAQIAGCAYAAFSSPFDVRIESPPTPPPRLALS
jgi:hypothetical protein